MASGSFFGCLLVRNVRVVPVCTAGVQEVFVLEQKNHANAAFFLRSLGLVPSAAADHKSRSLGKKRRPAYRRSPILQKSTHSVRLAPRFKDDVRGSLVWPLGPGCPTLHRPLCSYRLWVRAKQPVVVQKSFIVQLFL